MLQRKLLVGFATAGVVVGGGAAAMAAGGAPKHTTINAVTSVKFRINRYVQDGTRWQNDVYRVKSGGTISIVNLAASDGPHTFSVVQKSQRPRTTRQIEACDSGRGICLKIAKEFGANPESNKPPKFRFVNNGKGTNTPPNVDGPGDMAFIDAKQKAKVTLKVTAKPGTTLYFICAVHPWMQATLEVQK
jgi:hypothetical protein